MEAIAIITARGQSKRLPNKNIAELGNKPLLRWAIEAAKNSNAVSEIHITTDSEEYAKIPRNAGAKIINRPPKLATDTATSESAVAHALEVIRHTRLAARRSFPEIGVLMQCVAKGTVFANDVPRPIEEIVPTDKVLTNGGEFADVSQIQSHYHDGKIAYVTPFYLPPIQTTLDHKILVRTRMKVGRNKLGNPRWALSKPKWKNAGDLVPIKGENEGDFLVVPKITKTNDIEKIKLPHYRGFNYHRIPLEILVSEDFMFFCGAYLAEGDAPIAKNKSAKVRFSIRRDEPLEQQIIEVGQRLFGRLLNRVNMRRKVVFRELYLTPMAYLMRDLFYWRNPKRAWNKSLPTSFLYLPHEKQIALIRGLWRGDGHVVQNRRGNIRREATLTTTSRVLAWQVHFILNRLGILASLKERLTPDVAHGGLGKMSRLSFVVSVRGKQLKKFGRILDVRFEEDIRTWNRFRMTNRFSYVPLRKVAIQDYKGYVYDLSVPQRGNMVVNGIVVHNCTSPLTRPNTIAKAVEAVSVKGYDTAISVHESHHKPWWSFLRDADGQLREFMPLPKGYNSEVSPTIYFPTGGCYAFRTKFFLDQGRLYGGRMYGVDTTWAEAIDIDDDKDLEFARWALHILDGSLREVEENAV